LTQMQARLTQAVTSGTTVVEHYQFETMRARLLFPFGVQSGPSLGLDGDGTMLRETYDGEGHLLLTEELHFANTFAMRQATGDRWLTVAVLPPGTTSP
jgi:hypothetical protein